MPVLGALLPSSSIAQKEISVLLLKTTGLLSTTGIYQKTMSWNQYSWSGMDNQFKLCLLSVFVHKDLQIHSLPICLRGGDSGFLTAVMELSGYNHLAYKAKKCLLSGISQKKTCWPLLQFKLQDFKHLCLKRKREKFSSSGKNTISWYCNTKKRFWYLLYEYINAHAQHFSAFNSLNSWVK